MNPTDIAEQFNLHFSSVAENLALQLPVATSAPTDFLGTRVSHGFFLFNLTPADCKKLISNLKNTKSGINSK